MSDKRRNDGGSDHGRDPDGQLAGIEELRRFHFFIQLGKALDEFFDFRKQIGTRFCQLYILPLRSNNCTPQCSSNALMPLLIDGWLMCRDFEALVKLFL